MPPMSDDRDIDDILESLDQLLRSGGHHNDDHTDQTPPPLSSDKSKEEAENADQAVAEKPEASPLTTGDPLFDLPLGEESTAADEPLPEESAVSAVAAQRVVLTEDMMVNNPQGKLGLRMVAESSERPQQPEAAEAAEESEAVDVDHEQLERLMVQVSDDVIARLQEELPRMIRTSLYRHLNELRQDGDTPDADSK